MTAIPLLFLDHASALGGAEHSLLLILKHLDRARWQPHLVCAAGELAGRAEMLGTPVHTVALPRLRRSAHFPRDGWRAARHIARIARQIDAALIHSNTVRSTLYAAPAAKLARTPLLWHMRDFWLSEAQPAHLWLDRWGKRLLCRLSRQVVTNSHAVAAHLPCPQRLTAIPNGIEIARFDPQMDGSALRAQYHIPPDAPVAGMVGRLRPWKGQETFLHAAARVAARLPLAHFLIVGGNPFQADDAYALHLRQLAASLGLGGHVTFTGQLADPRPALAAMDVFVHPGAPEPFGLVNIEAMAMARPVVAFAHGALPEIVVDGQTGILIPPGDDQSMTQAIASLLDAPSQAAEMGAAGRARVARHFSIQQTVRSIEHVYEQILGDHG